MGCLTGSIRPVCLISFDILIYYRCRQCRPGAGQPLFPCTGQC